MNVVFDIDGLDGVTFAPTKHVQTGAIHRPAAAVAALHKSRQEKEVLAIDLDGLDGITHPRAQTEPADEAGSLGAAAGALAQQGAPQKDEAARTIAMTSIFGPDGVPAPPPKANALRSQAEPQATLTGLEQVLAESADAGPLHLLSAPLGGTVKPTSPPAATKASQRASKSPAKDGPRALLSGLSRASTKAASKVGAERESAAAPDGTSQPIRTCMKAVIQRICHGSGSRTIFFIIITCH